jgi:transcriptional regulator with XRE-family HTH domain
LETGEKASPPTLKVLQRIADVYGRDLREIMHEAGFVFETPAELDAIEESLDARFLRLVTHPALRPMRMDALVIEMIPPLVKRQWIEFAQKLEEHLLDMDQEVVNAILVSKPEAPPRKSDGAHDPTPKKPTPRTKLAIR